MNDPELLGKSIAFRDYTRCRKLEDYNRNWRAHVPRSICLLFADRFLRKIEDYEAEFPDFRETYDRREEQRNAHQR